MQALWRKGCLVLPEFYTQLFGAVFKAVSTGHAPLEVDPASVLTPREHEIFELLQSGLSNAQISEQTGTSVTTTKWHLKNIYSKLGVSNRTEAPTRHAAIKAASCKLQGADKALLLLLAGPRQFAQMRRALQ